MTKGGFGPLFYCRQSGRKENSMSVIIGSARIDERGKSIGGKAGDQKQSKAPDYSGEVSLQNFYIASKGWYILRPKSAEHAVKMAERMKAACNNVNIGYDQGGRLGIIQNGINTTKPTEADCSSLVRACVKEATGTDPGNFTTANEAAKLEATGLFNKRIAYKSGTVLYDGDVLVTKSKGHTAIVVSGAGRSASTGSGTSHTTYGGLDYAPVFNAIYYADRYGDLKAKYGYDSVGLFTHFLVYGMCEGRQAIDTFNVEAYRARYSDLKKAFGDNLPLYYQHYIQFGRNEGRNAI